jgi:predicted nucleotidyltransferase
MRISPDQAQIICKQIHQYFGDSAAVWLFGSRVIDNKKGGDVDLYVEADPHPLLNEIRCKIGLEEGLDMPVDLIVRQPFDVSPIARIAKTRGLKL